MHIAGLPGSGFDAHPTAAGGEHANDLAVAERGDDGGRRRRRGTQVEPRGGRGQAHAGVGSALRRRARRGRGRCGGGRRGRRGRRGQHDDALQPAQIVRLHIADLPLNRFHARPAALVGEYLHIVAVAQLVDDGGGGGGRRTQVEPRRSVGERHAGERTVGPGFQRRHGGLRRGRRGRRGSGRRRRRRRGRGRGNGRGRRRRRGPCRRVGRRRSGGRRRRRGRYGQERRLGEKDEVLALQIALSARGRLHAGPFACRFIGGDRVAVAHRGHGRGVRGGAGAQIQPPVLIGHGHHGLFAGSVRGRGRGGGRRRRGSVSGQGEERRLRPAPHRAVGDARPFRPGLVDVHQRSGGHAAHTGRGGRGLGVHIRAADAHQLSQRRFRRAAVVQAAAGGVGKRERAQLRAGIIEGEYIAEAHAPLRHGLRAALAHANAVAPAAEGDGEIVRAFFDIDRLVARGIDAQAVPRLQRAVGVHVHGILPPARHFDGEAQFCVQAAGRGVLGRVRLDIEDGNEGSARRALRRRAVQKRLRKACVQPRSVAANGRALCRGRGVAKVVGVVLDSAVREVPAPDVARGLGLAAVAGAVIAGGDGGTGVERHVARFVHGLDDARVAALVAAEHLIRGGVHHVVGARGARGHAAQRVVARRHGLRLERLQRPGVGHLIADHAVKVILDIDAQYGHNAATGNGEHQIAAVEAGIGGRRKAYAAGAALTARERAGTPQRRQRAVHREIQFSADGLYRGLRARGDGAGGVAVHIIGAGGREGEAGARAEPRQAHADHAVRGGGRVQRRKTGAQKQRRRQKNGRKPPPQRSRARPHIRHKQPPKPAKGQIYPPIYFARVLRNPALGERYTGIAGFSSQTAGTKKPPPKGRRRIFAGWQCLTPRGGRRQGRCPRRRRRKCRCPHR